jgi:hypothetical protein
MIMIKLGILIPVYNELDFIKVHLDSQMEEFSQWINKETTDVKIGICIWQSKQTIKTLELLNEKRTKAGLEKHMAFFVGGTGIPSVVGSLQLGTALVENSNYLLILPVDCFLSQSALKAALEFIHQVSHHSPVWAVFKKRYFTGGLMHASSFIQNHFVVPVLGEVFWTNGFLIPSHTFQKCFKRAPFLEDLEAGRRLQQHVGKARQLGAFILVSDRKYQQTGKLKRMIRNLQIYFLHVLGKKDLKTLRQFHESTGGE